MAYNLFFCFQMDFKIRNLWLLEFSTGWIIIVMLHYGSCLVWSSFAAGIEVESIPFTRGTPQESRKDFSKYAAFHECSQL